MKGMIILIPIVLMAACLNSNDSVGKTNIDSNKLKLIASPQDSAALSDSVLSFVIRVVFSKRTDTGNFQFKVENIENGVFTVHQTTSSSDGHFSPTVNWWNFDITTKRLWKGLTLDDRVDFNYDTLRYRF